MTDPFNHHPDTKFLQKKKNNTLTLGQVNNIIDNRINEILLYPPQIWGFTRRDFVGILEELKEELGKKCETH